jgi:hypothetical protein
MRRILLAFIVFATSALAADFTGNWTGEGVTNGESHPLYFVLKQAGNAVTGTGGPNASEQHPVQNGKVDGDKMIIEVGVGDKGTLHFELKTDGDGLKGTVEVRREAGTEAGTVTLKKAA